MTPFRTISTLGRVEWYTQHRGYLIDENFTSHRGVWQMMLGLGIIYLYKSLKIELNTTAN